MAWKCPACTSENIDGELRCVCGYELEVSPKRQRKFSTKRLLLWAGVIVSICGGLYCFFGYAMVASFSAANPENIEHYRQISKLYIVGMGASLVLLVACLVTIALTRKVAALST